VLSVPDGSSAEANHALADSCAQELGVGGGGGALLLRRRDGGLAPLDGRPSPLTCAKVVSANLVVWGLIPSQGWLSLVWRAHRR
jgi:hypothetical protein